MKGIDKANIRQNQVRIAVQRNVSYFVANDVIAKRDLVVRKSFFQPFQARVSVLQLFAFFNI